MTGVLTWLTGTRLGRWLVAAAAVALAVTLALLRAVCAGRAMERAKQDKASLNSLRDRAKTDDTVDKMAPDERRRSLAEWVRRDGKSL